ncbi:MAG: type I pullulanase, partial [Lactobacillus iners]|nr:type I pullulanase [Lactobacillus iners]
MHVYIIKVSVLKTEEGFLEKVMEKHVLKKFYGLTSPEFDRENYYGGSDLGLSFEKDKVIFKIWSPIADTVTVRLYHDLNNNSISDREITLDKENAGVWTCMISSKYIGWAYDYKFTFCDGTVTYANDPYAVAATINGVRSVIIDIAKIEVN